MLTTMASLISFNQSTSAEQISIRSQNLSYKPPTSIFPHPLLVPARGQMSTTMGDLTC
ncbi:MAG: hypothetical protein R3F28_13090 [Candidatus Kapaibacterium sp.]